MEYEEDQDEEHEEEIGLGSSYNDSVPNSTGAAAPKLNSPPPPLRKGRYKECLKNQAIGIGGHAVDGCCEFVPAGEEGSPESLKCAACNCHRNFHRKEADGGGAFFPFPHHRQQQLLLEYRTPGGYLHVAQSQQQRAQLLALPSSSGGRGDGEEYNYCSNPSSGSQKKRFRTKFSQEQKDKMVNLAERLGWRIQKQDEELVQHFCSELGIKRHVLKVWMHNNKRSSLANKT